MSSNSRSFKVKTLVLTILYVSEKLNKTMFLKNTFALKNNFQNNFVNGCTLLSLPFSVFAELLCRGGARTGD